MVNTFPVGNTIKHTLGLVIGRVSDAYSTVWMLLQPVAMWKRLKHRVVVNRIINFINEWMNDRLSLFTQTCVNAREGAILEA